MAHMVTSKAINYNRTTENEENVTIPIVRSPRSSFPPFSDRNLPSNASPWTTARPNQYPYPTPNPWRYNPSMQTYVRMSGAPYYLPTQVQPSSQPPMNLHPTAASTPKKIAYSEGNNPSTAESLDNPHGVTTEN
ncbi:hypothetical protein K7432_009322 [Basidiobolus ranarum]|uniref:Uncharacterized protein n=1 Tax=Basidiobolus ranarum TaxID=34480 RepID=A0ABR2WQF4_9FUNG